jgi:predicted ferric reductase
MVMMLAIETPKFVWYLMRGSGMVSLVLITVTVALGLIGVGRLRSARWSRSLTAGLHRNVSLLAVCFLAVHIVTALLDSWIGLAWFGAIIPFSSSYRPLWVGLGALSFDLLLAVMATSLFRTRIGHRSWRWVHWSAWLMWPLAAAHALGSGTDAGGGWGLALVLGCLGALVAAAICRVRLTVRARSDQTPSTVGARDMASGTRIADLGQRLAPIDRLDRLDPPLQPEPIDRLGSAHQLDPIGSRHPR